MGPQKDADGVYNLTLPMGDKKLPGIASEDIGKCAYGIFKEGGAYIGKSVGVSGEHVSGYEMAKTFSKYLGEPVRYIEISADVYRSFGFLGADDLGNMFQIKRDFNELYCNERDIQVSKTLNSELQNFDQWLSKNIDKIPVV